MDQELQQATQLLDQALQELLDGKLTDATQTIEAAGALLSAIQSTFQPQSDRLPVEGASEPRPAVQALAAA